MRQHSENWGLLGNKWAVDLLKGHLAQKRQRHAYLFTGPQGIGRRTLALRFAQALNCPQPLAPESPCRTCRSCQQIERMQHPDLSVVQSDQVGGILKVNQVRELLHNLVLAPYQSPHRIGLLLRFDEANPNAANALLKTLEEPPNHAVLILTALDSESLLPTIVSRCEVIRLRPLPIDELMVGLQERWKLDPEQAFLLSHISGGRPGYALYLHHDTDLLNLRKTLLEDQRQLLKANRVERFDYANKLSKDKSSFQMAIQIWISFWRDVLLRAAGSSAPFTNPDCEDQIQYLAARLGSFAAKQMVTKLEHSAYLLERYVNTRLTAEVLMLDLPYIQV
ncbi:MAG: DNA polymerase III subunit [Anaerolineales bacterium]|jgi:DNA polymerase-3 subunit delta'